MKLFISASAIADNSWVIADTHGCIKTLTALYDKIKPSRLYMLGDYIDRGPDSKGVIDFIRRHKNIVPIMGNHEDMLLQAYDSNDARIVSWWKSNGGDATLKSFKVKKVRDIPEDYIEWARTLPLFRRFGDKILSHAGVDYHSGKPPFRNTETNKDAVLWNRSVNPPDHRTLIVGHTPVSVAVMKRSLQSNKIFLDCGCAYGGKLAALRLSDLAVVTISSRD